MPCLVTTINGTRHSQYMLVPLYGTSMPWDGGAVNMPEYPAIRRFGEKLHTLRTLRGMTVRELTSALGYTGYGYIHGIEIGKNKPTTELVLRMAILFNVSTDQLLRDELEVT